MALESKICSCLSPFHSDFSREVVDLYSLYFDRGMAKKSFRYSVELKACHERMETVQTHFGLSFVH